jgi:hypothetical protein
MPKGPGEVAAAELAEGQRLPPVPELPAQHGTASAMTRSRDREISKEATMRATLLSLGLALFLADATLAHGRREPAPPSGLVSLQLDGASEVLWPFTGDDFSGTPSDPINLIFLGDADPRALRATLMSLGGDRSAFGVPNAFPFNCTWSDAIGRHQAAYAKADGWQGSAIQLQCGAYETLRFHLRLFREGLRTLANVHFEVMIPGTTEHEVLAWEFAEGFVALDLFRSGLLVAAPALTDPINPSPTYRTIRHQVYNGLPVELRAALGLPLDNQAAPIPIPNSGQATVLKLDGAPEAPAGVIERAFVHPFDQVIPKPFCATGPLDFIKVQGPIDMVHRVMLTHRGRYAASFHARGRLTVTPVDPLTGQATGPSFDALVRERHRSSISDRKANAAQAVRQYLLSDPLQSLVIELSVGERDDFDLDVDCGS